MPRKRELLVGGSLLGLLFLCGLFFLFRLSPPSSSYELLGYDDLPGWENDRHGEAFGAFLQSCRKLSPTIWQESCAQAQKLSNITDARARVFFEEFFTPLSFRDQKPGLFTGYFAPEYAGSRIRRDDYQTPLYLVPDDLQVLDLGKFDQSLRGERIVGEVRDGQFVPYKDRKIIEQGALKGRGLELVWLKNPKDAFFLHIQGSGRIMFEDGSFLQAAYGGKNGRPYRAIGKYLIKEGAVAPEDMSLQAIAHWMEENPDRAQGLMWKNPSYVFFEERKEAGIIGTLGVPLTAGRSLAVDHRHIPLGIPIWLDIHSDTETKSDVIQRLVMAQDTGGAIRGPVRGDLFWGTGARAALKAGPMKEKGTYYLLLPHALAARYVEGDVL